jgi:2,4-dienoyl-CoA reductase-like NADH-dependent reductase (Old Yellow Enzyme family)
MIYDAAQADAVIATGQADCVAIGRAFLDNPRWGWHAAQQLSVGLGLPPSYLAVTPAYWPAAKLVRPSTSPS